MKKPTVYIETTVIGHIATWDQTDVLVYSRQIQSRRWWAMRDRFDLAVSQVVVDECAAGDSSAASERLNLRAGIPILAASDDVQALAEELIDHRGIPASEPRDALHISLAAVNGIKYLLTLNFTHIANAETRLLIEQICRDSGYTPPVICSPDELLGN
ncbi:MAG: type II toxin-antitoxin system VapC family toxin [Pirellulales bacterium]